MQHRSVLIFIFGFFGTNAEIYNNAKIFEDGELVFAQILYRHGDRTPVETYPLDPYKDLSQWPTGWGQLTNIGKQQHYILGKWLRQRYDSLVNKTYSKDEIYIRSTDVDRTLMSALSNMAGFYPPVDTDVWNPNLAWQPIPIHTIPEHKDEVLAMKRECPVYQTALSQLKKSNEFRKFNQQHKQLYEYLTNNTGKHIHDIGGVEQIYSILFIEELYNKTLPDWTKAVYPDVLRPIASRDFATDTYTRDLARLKAGPLLKEMLNRFKNKSESALKPDRSLWFYSAHDSTVASLLNTLKIFEYHTPPYRACVMLELRKFNNDYYVSVFYKNTTKEPQLMILPDCGVTCPLQEMFELYADVLPNDWHAECKQKTVFAEFFNSFADSIRNQGTIVAIIASAAVLLVVILFVQALFIYNRRWGHTKKFYKHVVG